ncbi:XRE family transcriptional regulator [Streptacidiphilus pinicola]|uniref:XRE family transcriptional regulator n=1 Tax=Streptacidiphilus pinicola TaxID=2219663 RepID=A0A2X0KH02_9ACTN|nr:helix-turn-helix transcriptional regulator [Streptacidiphilus pinicola]RAG86359.1 XRE family transcriptional regulator [Streptacidiphilus pinicola]
MAEGVEQRTRRTAPSGLGEMLNRARLRTGWRRREAARILGIAPSYLFDLEVGLRSPSVTVAQSLADGLALTDPERAALLAAAVADAGPNRPIRPAARDVVRLVKH